MLPDTSIGPYQVIRRLGQGGLGEVALAYDARLKRRVALKGLLPGDGSSDTRATLIREARAAAMLSHPGIAAIYDIVADQTDRQFIVMEYVEGETLRARLDAGTMPIGEALRIADQLCDALSEAHDRGLIHRDLKPANVILTPQGKAKILDFGLARRMPSADRGDATTEGSVIAPGLIGTVGYIAPEQITSGEVTERTDIFSLGAMLYEMFSGLRAFETREPMAYAMAVTTTDAPRADVVNPNVPAVIAAVLARSLARDPAGRFQSVAELRAALNAPADATITLAGTLERPRASKWSWAIAAVIGSLAIGLTAWFAFSSFTPSQGDASVIAILPVNAGGADASAAAVGAGITSITASNLSRIGLLNVINAPGPPIATAAELEALLKKLDARWALATTVRRTDGGFSVDIAIHAAGERGGPAWHATYNGSELDDQAQLLRGLPAGLVVAGVLKSVSRADRDSLAALPTRNNTAFIAYAEGRARLQAVTNPAAGPEAAVLFQKAIGLDPTFALALAGLSDAYWLQYLRTREVATAERAGDAARQALALDPAQAAVQVSLGSMLNQTGRSSEALAAIERALALQPNNDEAYRLKGRILAQTGRVDEALAALNQAIALRPSFVGHYENKGFVLYRAGRFKESAEAYRKVTELAPEYPTGYQMRGTALHQLGDTAQAIGNYEHAVRLGPSATAYSNLALSYYEAGRFDEALAAYKESIARDVERPAVHRNIGDVYHKLGKHADALASYAAAITTAEKRLRVNPSDATTIAMLALCEAKLGRRAPAERHAAEALVIAPTDREVVVRNAEVYAILRQPDRSLKYLAQAIAAGYEVMQAQRNDELTNVQGLPGFADALATPPVAVRSAGDTR